MRWADFMVMSAVTLAGLPTLASAQSIANNSERSARFNLDQGNDFYAACKTSDDFNRNVCVIYLQGFFAGQKASWADQAIEPEFGNQPYCLPPHGTLPQYLDVVIKFMEDEPDIRNFPSGTLIEGAFLRAYPCKKN
ncbi:Rap1a/Tai family immunity protein [Tsuneonella mangrovi]|uniref:Rap1a/Tai family immunity protein n=1 Tax=Tsuneonella mangrovi TaxID=1982042 RepID=UPI001471FBAB|nr:Rap1a/Tai family immunity protein [Tsuneonella mangrovi]